MNVYLSTIISYSFVVSVIEAVLGSLVTSDHLLPKKYPNTTNAISLKIVISAVPL